MKNKTLVIIVLIIALAVCVFYYLNQGKSLSENIIQQNQDNPGPNEGQSQGKLVTDDFEINIPEGWTMTEPVEGASAMAVDQSGRIDDPSVELINFKSYMAVSYDVLSGRTLTEYMQDVKDTLSQLVPEVSFGEENDAVINDRNARGLELEMTQQEVDFKVLIVTVEGENGDVWTISFNTTEALWDSYKEEFSNIANSFKLKINN